MTRSKRPKGGRGTPVQPSKRVLLKWHALQVRRAGARWRYSASLGPCTRLAAILPRRQTRPLIGREDGYLPDVVGPTLANRVAWRLGED